MGIATARRLNDELNIDTSLEHIYRFCYTADFGEAGSENELCHVYLGHVEGEPQPNQSEISSVRYVSSTRLEQELAESPQHFTPWFKQEWQALNGEYRERLARYCDPV